MVCYWNCCITIGNNCHASLIIILIIANKVNWGNIIYIIICFFIKRRNKKHTLICFRTAISSNSLICKNWMVFILGSYIHSSSLILTWPISTRYQIIISSINSCSWIGIIIYKNLCSINRGYDERRFKLSISIVTILSIPSDKNVFMTYSV